MLELKRFSAMGRTDIIERRDCLFNPYAEKRSSYLRRKDLTGPRYDFSEESIGTGKKIRISEIKL